MRYILINEIIVLSSLLATCQLQKPNVDSRRHDVYIAGFFPFGKGVENANTGTKLPENIFISIKNGFPGVLGRGVMPSVKLALDHVNEHSTILRNYRLHMWWNDTMVREFLYQ